jgi:hypothetical protein
MSGEFGVSPLSLPDGVQVLCASDHLRTGLQSLLHHTGKGCEPRLTFRGSEEWAELSRAMMCGSMVAYSISFAARYSDSRALEIGDRSSSGPDCCFVIGKNISIGKECMIANEVIVFDSPAHGALECPRSWIEIGCSFLGSTPSHYSSPT